MEYFYIILGAALINNIVLVKMLGLCPFLGISKKLETSAGMGIATSFVLTIGCGASFIINEWLLKPNDLFYLQTLSFIITIAATVQLTEIILQKTSPLLHRVLGIYLPLITTNCAVLGVPLLNIAFEHSFFESLIFGFASALGFTMTLILFSGIREKLEGADIPAPLKGSPIALVTASLMSLAFMGFSGLDKLSP